MENPPLFSPDVVKIVVLGEPGCGKTGFINGFCSQYSYGAAFKLGPVIVYPCKLRAFNEMIRAAIFEIPGNLDTPNLVESLDCCRANGIVLMYAVDDPYSFQMVTEKYISALVLWNPDVFSKQSIVLVGSNTERRDDQRVIEWLAQENQVPVTFAEGKKLFESLEIDEFFEYSSYDLTQMKDTFEEILYMALACMDIKIN